MITRRWLGRVPYVETWEAQKSLREEVIAGRSSGEIWTLEHEPVVTLGRRGGQVDAEALAARGVEVVQTRRGGLATYHGPGQLVGYLIVPLVPNRWTVRGVVSGVEQGIIEWLAGVGVRAHLRDGAPGVWIEDRKICAVGMHFRKGVSMHGFALNLTTPLSAFDGFVPCGLTETSVTSLLQETGRGSEPANVGLEVADCVLSKIFAEHV